VSCLPEELRQQFPLGDLVVLSDLIENAVQRSDFEDTVGRNCEVMLPLFGMLGKPKVAARLSRDGIAKP
jgi:hypothetical protein